MDKKVQIAIVLYKKRWTEVRACKSIEQFLHCNKEAGVLIYDNSPSEQEELFFHEPRVEYRHNPANPGLAEAYNSALDQAIKTQCEWLILLDQDTDASEQYFQKVLETNTDKEQVVCLLPKITDNQKQLSPLLAEKYIDRNWQYPKEGVEKRRVMGINSGSVWRVSFLREIQAFPKDFPLDFLDHWLFYQVHQYNRFVCILPLSLTHDLSVLNYDTMSSIRYRNILSAERRYYTTVETALLQRHIQQLKRRTAKQFLTYKNRKVWRLTWKEYRKLKRKYK